MSSARPVAALDDDDLLGEILLRLPPQPSSLPRASLVCKRWRRLVHDPGLLRRFRAFHRKPPLLGFFSFSLHDGIFNYFTPTLDLPDRIPAARFSLPQYKGWRFRGCRHGLALLLNATRLEAVVWDPMTGDHRCVSFPPGLYDQSKEMTVLNAAVLCAAGEAGHVHGDCHLSPFKLVLVRMNDSKTRALAWLYESATGVWGNLISLVVTSPVSNIKPSILVGNALYWQLIMGGMLEFDLEMQNLAVIEKPAGAQTTTGDSRYQILRTEESRLGLAIWTGLSMEVWERKVNSGGSVKWVLQKTVQLDKFLPQITVGYDRILGYDEDTNVIFLTTVIGVFMVQLESEQSRNIFSKRDLSPYYPYTNFYTAGRRIGGGVDGAEMWNNT